MLAAARWFTVRATPAQAARSRTQRSAGPKYQSFGTANQTNSNVASSA
jgi:hypothetical protein